MGKFYARKGLFQPLFNQGQGRATVQWQACHRQLSGTGVFLNQKPDPTAYSFGRPCPPTEARISAYDHKGAIDETPVFDRLNIIRLPEGYKSQLKEQYVVQSHMVEREDTILLGSLLQIFESADKAAEFEEQAAGSGTRLLELMRAWGDTATPKDHSLVTKERNP